MKTTHGFDDRLIRAAKVRRAQEGKTPTQPSERTRCDNLQADSGSAGNTFRANLLTKCGKPVVGVDVDDRDALHERMEAPGQ